MNLLQKPQERQHQQQTDQRGRQHVTRVSGRTKSETPETPKVDTPVLNELAPTDGRQDHFIPANKCMLEYSIVL